MAYNYAGAGAFAPSGITYRVDFADDSTEVSVAMKPSSAVQLLANVTCVVNFGVSDGDVQAIFPTTNGEQGEGCLVQKDWQTNLALPGVADYNDTGVMYMSVASDQPGFILVSLGDYI